MVTPKILYHYTLIKNLPFILKEGLIPDKGTSSFYPLTHTFAAGKLRENKVWLDTRLFKLKTKGNTVLAIDTRYLDSTKLERSVLMSRKTYWYVHHDTIPIVAIKLIERLD